jgi:hypothetical protein
MHFNALIYTYQFYIGQFACRDVSTGATGATYSHQEEQIQPSARSNLNFPLGYVPGFCSSA